MDGAEDISLQEKETKSRKDKKLGSDNSETGLTPKKKRQILTNVD